jgi:hypothetical protein
MIIKDEEDYNVFTVAGSLLSETDCEHAWIFILEDWIVSGAFTTEEGIRYFSTAGTREPFTSLEEQIGFIKELIREEQPHCIGVLQHTEGDCFRIVTDRIYENRGAVNGKKNKRMSPVKLLVTFPIYTIARIWCLGLAPTDCSTMLPSFRTISVGIVMIR